VLLLKGQESKESAGVGPPVLPQTTRQEINHEAASSFRSFTNCKTRTRKFSAGIVFFSHTKLASSIYSRTSNDPAQPNEQAVELINNTNNQLNQFKEKLTYILTQ